MNSIQGSGRSPDSGNATHSSILDWKSPWAEEPGGLQSMGSQESDRTQQLHHHHHHDAFQELISKTNSNNTEYEIKRVKVYVKCLSYFSLCVHAYMLNHFSHVQLFAAPWTVACQGPLSMRFSGQKFWSGLPLFYSQMAIHPACHLF